MHMLSRVGDALYWMSRYLERAEHTARLLEVHLGLQLESFSSMSREHWQRMIDSLGLEPPEGLSESDLVQWVCFDPSNHLSIVSSISFARDNARQVREHTSSEMWEQINKLFHDVRSNAVQEEWEADPVEFLRSVRDGAHLFQGITDSTMNHGEGWHFIQLGRYIERASASALLLDVHFKHFQPTGAATIDFQEHSEWIGLLKSLTAFEAYCKVYTADLKPERIAEFLLLSEEFPHSIRFAVDSIESVMEWLPDSISSSNNRPARLAGKLCATLTYTQMDEIFAGGMHEFLEAIQLQCGEIHAAVHQVYIDYPVDAALGA
jgi:uncharacterized alpha-E superfamily protein